MMNGHTKTIKLNEADNATLSAIANFKQEYDNYESSNSAAWSEAGEAIGTGAGAVIALLILGLTPGGPILKGLEVALVGITVALTVKNIISVKTNVDARNQARNNAMEIFLKLQYPINLNP